MEKSVAFAPSTRFTSCTLLAPSDCYPISLKSIHHMEINYCTLLCIQTPTAKLHCVVAGVMIPVEELARPTVSLPWQTLFRGLTAKDGRFSSPP